MSFREKSMWITFLLLLGVYGTYFVRLAAQALDARSLSGGGPTSLMAWLIVLVIFEVIIHVVLAARSPREAQAPADERERQIELLATRGAYFVLFVGAFACLGALYLGADSALAANGVLLAIWLAELTRHGAQLYFYRRAI